VNDNYVRLAEAVGLTREQLTQLARNSFEGSFLSDGEKAARISEVDAYART
jgi:adenosine deaminase